MDRRFTWPWVGLTVWLLSAAPAVAQCAGDCDENRSVGVSELITGVNIALSRADVSACTSFDTDHNDRVEVNELVAVVNNVLRGCRFAGRYVATVVLDNLDPAIMADIELLAALKDEVAGTVELRVSDGQGTTRLLSVSVSGSFNTATGSFTVTGSRSFGLGGIRVTLSGQLGGAFTLQTLEETYDGSFTTGATTMQTSSPTPSPTATPDGNRSPHV